jgi:hypothetical protein
VLFQLLIPGLTPVTPLESKSRFEIVTELAVTGKQRTSSHLKYMRLLDGYVIAGQGIITEQHVVLHVGRN